jgi:hypothetical protein
MKLIAFILSLSMMGFSMQPFLDDIVHASVADTCCSPDLHDHAGASGLSEGESYTDHHAPCDNCDDEGHCHCSLCAVTVLAQPGSIEERVDMVFIRNLNFVESSYTYLPLFTIFHPPVV